jgi:hypothetical protein
MGDRIGTELAIAIVVAVGSGLTTYLAGVPEPWAWIVPVLVLLLGIAHGARRLSKQ